MPATPILDTVRQMLDKYGESSQIDVCIEEMSELTKELIKYKRTKIYDRERHEEKRAAVVEEMSDVLFMMEYLKVIFHISEEDLENVIIEKAERTKERYL